jgi:hypothetical protein
MPSPPEGGESGGLMPSPPEDGEPEPGPGEERS